MHNLWATDTNFTILRRCHDSRSQKKCLWSTVPAKSISLSVSCLNLTNYYKYITKRLYTLLWNCYFELKFYHLTHVEYKNVHKSTCKKFDGLLHFHLLNFLDQNRVKFLTVHIVLQYRTRILDLMVMSSLAKPSLTDSHVTRLLFSIFICDGGKWVWFTNSSRLHTLRIEN